MGGGSSSSWSRLGDIKSLEQRAKEALQQGRKNVFISFAFEDIDEVNLLRAQAKNDNNDIEFNDRSVKDAYDSDRADYIRDRLTDRINQASTTVVYLSDDTAKSRWVEWEVNKSLELGKKVIGVYAGDAPPKTVPDWISKRGIKVVPWKNLATEL
ncbi:TIR domain-containing protein [Bradyrhizobium sp. AS23.2]|uniref:TIR domain-containing protein n=1 Tax=Bradyrhizobium sp. AS23.2 TaxID=1680155 RepID=UPI00093DD88D|nr:TIR domain-containing protein [Bradyrhizobium sp. AS23.2]OKO67465.1 molecular chaperone Tir [Bradyrhizobium sp. AS23.2]